MRPTPVILRPKAEESPASRGKLPFEESLRKAQDDEGAFLQQALLFCPLGFELPIWQKIRSKAEDWKAPVDEILYFGYFDQNEKQKFVEKVLQKIAKIVNENKKRKNLSEKMGNTHKNKPHFLHKILS